MLNWLPSTFVKIRKYARAVPQNVKTSVFAPAEIEAPWRAEVLSREALGDLASRLANEHSGNFGLMSGTRLLERYRANRAILERVYTRLSEASKMGEPLTAGAEWLLDNYHVVERHALAIKKYLPRGYYRTLPKFLNGEMRGLPRAYDLTLELIVHTDAVVDPQLAAYFVGTYQKYSELGSGELWAFPIMLRFALLENLCRLTREAEKELLSRREAFAVVEAVLGNEARTGTEIMIDLARKLTDRASFFPHGALEMLKRLRARGRKAFLALQFLEEALREKGCDPDELLRAEDHIQAARQISVGNTLTSLTAIDQINWRQWFEDVSLVHQTLCRDPSGIYPLNEFASRDHVRHQIEKMSRKLKQPESVVAAAVVQIAENSAQHPARTNEDLVQRYVGYFLLGDGQSALKRKLNMPQSIFDRLGIWASAHAFGLYVSAISALTLVFLGYVGFVAWVGHGSQITLAIAILLFLLPASEFGSSLTQYLITRFVPPRPLPRLQLEGVVPPELKTLVAVHIICSSAPSIESAIERLEIRFLGNEDPAFTYVLMADLPDARTESAPSDEHLVRTAIASIEALNARYISDGPARFLLFFRKRLWNEREGKWMGWERKRGKVEELNRFLLGKQDTTLTLHVGTREQLIGTKFVITLDSDSQLPRDTAKKLVATIAHPMNRPVFDEQAGRVTRGYGLIQPRVTISLTSAIASWFASLFSGQAGLDPYTNVVSDVYQDVFGEGSYIGKGIYDVAIFERALRDRVPENALLSHDLFEGSFVRAGLASDIELYDDFPPRYVAYAKRLHRWIRGDWQLLPWLFGRVPTRKGRARSNLPALARWKFFDNLRRSLLPPACFLALLAGWTILPSEGFIWSFLVLLVVSFPVFTGLASAFALPALGLTFGGLLEGIGRDLWRNAIRALCAICILPHQAMLSLHAVAITLYRVLISHRRLLEWEPAEQAEKRIRTERKNFISLYIPAMGVIVVAVGYVVVARPTNLPYAIPFFTIWLVAPFLVHLSSRAIDTVDRAISPDDRKYLFQAGYKIWLFFKHYLREEYHFLMPDNLQMVPKPIVAERTSPTNISLSMLSALAANDLAFIPLNVSFSKIEQILISVSKLDKFRGHLFNWYGIRSAEPLSPRYVSTVDSGNFVGHLYVLEEALLRCEQDPLITINHVDASRTIYTELVTELASHGGGDLEALKALGSKLWSDPFQGPIQWLLKIDSVSGVLDILYDRFARDPYNKVCDFVDLLRNQATVLAFCPWALRLQDLLRAAPDLDGNGQEKLQRLIGEGREIFTKLNGEGVTIKQLNALSDWLQSLVVEIDSTQVDDSVRMLLIQLSEGIELGRRTIATYRSQVENMLTIIRSLVKEMDFTFLYDDYRNLFTIGFNVDHARRDGSFYDLLASEARLLSFLAVARGIVPQKHWFSLGRSLTNTAGGKTLLSWSGTMFEYLMPNLVMRDFPTTLLGRSARAVVRAHIAYGRKNRIPWGISESAYSGVDFEKTYQYRAFGVPGLGLKRGLSEDLVVSPYSTFLALSFSPTVATAVNNLRDLARCGALGIYGFYEAIDFTPSRGSQSERQHNVAAFFAHHQGMSLVGLSNLLTGDRMIDRFHSHAAVRSAELLLHERFPERIPAIVPHESEVESVSRASDEKSESGLDVVSSPHTAAPRVRVLSNGRYTTIIDASGGGVSIYDRNIFLTRWREDPTTTPWGYYIYLHEPTEGRTWSAGYQPSKVQPDTYEAVFTPGRIEFKRVDHQLFVHTEITVATEDDVELRRVTVTNLSDAKRTIEIASYIEPVLAPRRTDSAHPAFSKMFVSAEVLPDSDAIICARRPRSPHESELFFFHRVTLHTSYAPVRFYTSRRDFIGRGCSLEEPQVFEPKGRVAAPSADGSIDPMAGLRVKVELDPGMAETIVFITGASRSRSDVLQSIERYQELMHVSRAFELAWSRAQVELRNHAYSVGQVDLFHRLAGCLFYGEGSVGGAVEVIQGNRLAQSGLWRFGVSGDLPIVLVKVSSSRHIKVVQEVLLAHHYLRERGVEFDCVVVHHYPGGYLQQLAEELEYAVRTSPAGQLMDRPGGVYLRSTQQISEIENTLLETVARVVIDSEVGGLQETLMTPAFEQVVAAPARSERAPTAIKPAMTVIEPLLAFNGLGGFDPDSYHYIFPRVGPELPPAPWCNVIANPQFGFLISESGGGYTWSGNSRENRLTAWSNDPVIDPLSEVFYLRDMDSGRYWSLTPKPCGDDVTYRVEHGFGVSTFHARAGAIESVTRMFVSLHERVKWFNITLTNHEPVEVKLELFFHAELVVGINREESYRYVVTSFDRTSETLCAVNYYNNEFAGRVVSIGASEQITGITTSRLEFLGRNGDLKRPLSIERAAQTPFFMTKPRPVKLSGRTGAGFDPCGTMQITLTLRPREQRDVCFYLAESSSFDEARTLSTRYRSLATVRTELQRVEKWWQELLSTVEIESPVESFNILINRWLLYQTVSCRIEGRSGFYQSGGAFGFRDQLQDVLALLYIRPELVRAQILLHAQRQFREGDVQHWWHPPTGRGVRTRISDDLLWLPYVVSRYVEVTGDVGVVDESIPFLEGPTLAEDQMESYFIPDRSNESASILEHCVRAFRATSKVGPHGLPLIGAGDWNDGMNEVGREGKGESVWLAWFQKEVIRRFIPVLLARGQKEIAVELQQRSEAFEAAVEAHAWDGAWYRRAFYDDGTPIGSHESDECKIDSLTQSWSVIAGGANHERVASAMKSVHDKLIDEEGKLIKVLTPPFQHTPKNPGYIKGYPPGIRENGGQYTHAAAWVIIANAILGYGDETMRLFEMINPINHTRDSSGVLRYKAEPYVMCGDVYSEGELRGRAGWSWYTGSSGWLYQAGVEYVLGLKVSPQGIAIDPCIPSAWTTLKAKYHRSGRVFVIHIKNPSRKNRGVSAITVNGESWSARVIPFESPAFGSEVHVEVVL